MKMADVVRELVSACKQAMTQLSDCEMCGDDDGAMVYYALERAVGIAEKYKEDGQC